MLINLGCGDRYAQGWHNVDHAGSPHTKDETLDITGKLPWAPNSILHVYMGHVLEHISLAQCKTLLRRIKPLVQSHGQILIVSPDIAIASQMAKEGTLDVTLDSLKFGASRWPGDEHKWECTSVKIVKLLRDTGWINIEDIGIDAVAHFWPVADRGPKWQCAITARSGDK